MSEEKRVEVRGKALQCHVCQNEQFWERRGQLNTRLATFFDFDWLNPQATCYICTQCGYVHWFLQPPQ